MGRLLLSPLVFSSPQTGVYLYADQDLWVQHLSVDLGYNLVVKERGGVPGGPIGPPRDLSDPPGERKLTPEHPCFPSEPITDDGGPIGPRRHLMVGETIMRAPRHSEWHHLFLLFGKRW